jgi:hypothetical protein
MHHQREAIEAEAGDERVDEPELRRPGEVIGGRRRRRPPVSRKVGRDAAEGALQELDERSPFLRVVGVPVQEEERRPDPFVDDAGGDTDLVEGDHLFHVASVPAACCGSITSEIRKGWDRPGGWCAAFAPRAT